MVPEEAPNSESLVPGARSDLRSPDGICSADGVQFRSHPACGVCLILAGPAHLETTLDATGLCSYCARRGWRRTG